MRDLYEILGVSQRASDDEIKRAYRRKARELHPDTGGDEEAFKELTTAYEVLKNPQARANYDQYGDPRGPGGLGGADVGFGDLGDLINAFFGGGSFGGQRTTRTNNAGRDALVELVLTLEQAAEGGPHEVEIDLALACQRCAGSGAAPGSKPMTCPTCGGQGAVQQVRQSIFGQMLSTAPCPDCAGTGTRIPEPCPACGGQGRQRAHETITVEVPPGVDDGRRLRLSGRGEAGRQGAQAGDLYVRVRVRPHELFVREGNDLHCELRIPMVQAALGARLKLDTLYGQTEVEVPAGTQYGDIVSLSRYGMPRLGGGGARGALRVHVIVETPTRLDDEQAELLRRFAELREETFTELPTEEHRSFFGRLRGAFGG